MAHTCYSCHGYSAEGGVGARLVGFPRHTRRLYGIHSQARWRHASCRGQDIGSGVGRHLHLDPIAASVAGRQDH